MSRIGKNCRIDWGAAGFTLVENSPLRRAMWREGHRSIDCCAQIERTVASSRDNMGFGNRIVPSRKASLASFRLEGRPAAKMTLEGTHRRLFLHFSSNVERQP
jgi:hypothetical protein